MRQSQHVHPRHVIERTKNRPRHVEKEPPATPTAGRLAWDLAEHVRSKLNVSQLNTMFVDLGTGNYDVVITRILGALPQIGATLTPDLVLRSQVWVNGYRSSHDYPNLLRLVRGLPSNPAPVEQN